MPVREPDVGADMVIMAFGSMVTAADDSCIPKFYIVIGAYLLYTPCTVWGEAGWFGGQCRSVAQHGDFFLWLQYSLETHLPAPQLETKLDSVTVQHLSLCPAVKYIFLP